MDAIRVKSDEDFERLRDRIDLEVSRAGDHWNLLKGLEESRAEYYLEMNESNTFWHLTLIAHRDAVLSHLCRLYDKDNGALSLGRFLLTVKANRTFFSDAAFRERLKGNPHIDKLVKNSAIEDSDLDAEFASVSGSDPLVIKLWDLRNKVISHTDAERVRTNAPNASHRWLPTQDTEELLSRGADITGKYSLLYRASRYSGIAGEDDYKSMLRLLRRALASHRAEIEQEIEQAQRAATVTPRFVVCIDNSDYESSLELHKIYPVVSDPGAARDGDLRIVDESGEDYLYSAARFVAIDVPMALERTMLKKAS